MRRVSEDRLVSLYAAAQRSSWRRPASTLTPVNVTGATGRGRLRAARAAHPALVSFAGVFGATFLCFLAIGAVLPVLPRYVRGPIGAGDITLS